MEKYAEDKWAEYRELAIKYGSNAIRFANNKEWIERAHFALAWIYIHDRNYAYAREHIEQLPSVSSNSFRKVSWHSWKLLRMALMQWMKQ